MIKHSAPKLVLSKETVATLKVNAGINAGMKAITAGQSNCKSCDYASYASKC